MWSKKRTEIQIELAIVDGALMALERVTCEIDKQRRDLETLQKSLKEQKEALTKDFS